MLEVRNWIAVSCGLWVGLSVGCSEDSLVQPMDARGVEPPAAAPSGGAPTHVATPPVGPTNAAGSMAIAPTQSPRPEQKPEPKPEPPSGLPIGPEAPPDANQPMVTRVIPTDTRPVFRASIAQPVSGGTLVATADDKLAIASDPERDRVSIVDLATQRLVATISLQPGDEPGRLALDDAGRVHVALRRSGAVASIDLASRSIVERRAVCTTPRGIGFDASQQQLIVACMGGELVRLPVRGSDGITQQRVDSDLRDVVVRANGTFVTRLKSAEVLAIGADSGSATATRPPVGQRLFSELDGSSTADTIEPVGARRTIATADGLLMVHVGARNGDILVPATVEGGEMKTVPTTMTGASPYGGGNGCSGIVTSTMTKFDATGKPVESLQFQGTLPVDIAQSLATGEIAVALAGAVDPLAPVGGFAFGDSATAGIGAVPVPPTPTNPDGTAIVGGVMRFDANQGGGFQKPIDGCLPVTDVVATPGPATAVTFLSDGRLLVQTREPATLTVTYKAQDFNTSPVQISLGGVSVLDTGHEIFHRDAGAGVSCASCHIEGGDDGHTWHFVDQGPRRTQSMLGGLEGTAPFHWIGDMRDLGMLVEHVFVGRMGGVHQDPARLGALDQWMNSIKAPPALRAAGDPAVLRGHELFVGEAECGKCHNGEKLTNNMTVDVGTGVALQVPALVAIGYRSPWIHTGCAKTLHERFDPACGGATHGKTAQLTSAQIDDLVAYLESL